MTIKYIERLVKMDQEKRGVSEHDHTEGYVDYAMAAWLFDMRFNEPCDTYFHNEDDYADFREGTPERDQWECRESNWEMCGSGKFINHPKDFIIRHRYARPTYAQVLRWIEKEWGARIRYSAHGHEIRVDHLNIPIDKYESVIETFSIKIGKPISPIQLLQRTTESIMARLRLCGYSVPTMPDYAL